MLRRLAALSPLIAVLAVLTACGAGRGVAVGSAAPSGWQPPVQALPSPDTELRTKLGPYAEYLLGDARVSPTSQEYGEYLVACYRSAGFRVSQTATNEISANVPAEQREAWYAVRDACMEAAVTDGVVMEPRSDDAYWGVIYDAFQITYACMEEKGLPVDPPPDREAFIQADSLNWDPHALAPPDHPDAFESECPKALSVLLPELAAEREAE